MGKKLFVVFNIGFVLLLGIMLYQAFRIYLMKESINTEIIMLEEKVNEYAEKKKNLQSKIDNFSEEEKIERIARDRLNMKKEGEIIYKVVGTYKSYIFSQGVYKRLVSRTNTYVLYSLYLCKCLCQSCPCKYFSGNIHSLIVCIEV